MAGSGTELLDRFREGERDAVLTVSRLARSVVGHRGYYVPPREREDLVQEVVVQAYRAAVAPDFRPSLAFEAFVRSVAQRRCVDWLRQHRPSEPVHQDLPAANPDPERSAIALEMRSLARKALSALGYSCRRLISLRVRDGLSYRDIAARLGRTEQGVRAKMYKCLKQARALLETEGRTVHAGEGSGE